MSSLTRLTLPTGDALQARKEGQSPQDPRAPKAAQDPPNKRPNEAAIVATNSLPTSEQKCHKTSSLERVQKTPNKESDFTEVQGNVKQSEEVQKTTSGLVVAVNDVCRSCSSVETDTINGESSHA
jgi:hypothetical protein